MNALMPNIAEMPLFAIAKRNDPLSSYVAGEKFIKSKDYGLHRKIIIDTLRRCGALTGKGIAANCELSQNQIMRRMKEMVLQGLVRGIGRRERETIYEVYDG